MTPTAFDNVFLLPEYAPDVPLDLGERRLVPGCRGELTEPVEACLELFCVHGTTVLRQVRAPEDLAPYLTSIRNTDEALALVRLFTDADTAHLFSKREPLIEVEIQTDRESPRPGALTPEQAVRYDVAPHEVEHEDGSFRITRTLARVVSLSGPHALVRRTERVARDGTYTLASEHDVGALPAGALALPYYE